MRIWSQKRQTAQVRENWTRVTKSQLVVVLYLIGRERSVSYLDQSFNLKTSLLKGNSEDDVSKNLCFFIAKERSGRRKQLQEQVERIKQKSGRQSQGAGRATFQEQIQSKITESAVGTATKISQS